MEYTRAVEGNRLMISDASGRPVLSMLEEEGEEGMRISLHGEVTVDVSHEFEDELVSASTVCKNLMLDFGGLSHICGAGLNALLTTQRCLEKYADSSLTLRNVRGPVLETFRETGFSDLFDMEEM